MSDVSLVPAIRGAASAMMLVQIGLCLLFAFAVLAFGAVEVWSQTILECGAALLLIIWGALFYRNADAKIRWNPLNWPFLGLILIGILQLTFHGTAYAFLTRTELLRFSAYFIVFFLLAQTFSRRAEFEALVWFLIFFCFAVSLLGIIQHFTADKQIYWMSSPLIQNDRWSVRESEPIWRLLSNCSCQLASLVIFGNPGKNHR